MRRILILGCCGAGKSTLAQNLHYIIGIPVIHLDRHYHLPNWEEPPKEQWETKIKELVNQDKWIMDGNYSGSLNLRIPRADTIIYLNYSTLSSLYRVVSRTIKYYGKERPNMAEGCIERFDIEFLHYVATFNMTRGRTLLKKLKTLHSDKEIIILQKDDEVSNWLSSIKKQYLSSP